MAQTKKKRKRKHRGTPAGTIEARGRTGRPPTKAESAKKQTAQERRNERMAKPPTWRGALNRSAIAALLFAVVVSFIESPVAGVTLGAAMIVLYLPMTYYMDLFLHRRYQNRAPGKR